MNTRKEKEKQLRERYIIDIAQKLFLEKGISNTTMDDIAKNCELSKTTVYKNFRSKGELEILVYQKIHAIKMKYLISEMEKKNNAYEKLLAFGNAYYSFFRGNPCHLQFQLKFDYLGVNKKNIRKEILDNMIEFLDADIKYMNSIIKQGVEEGVFRKDLDSVKTLEIFYVTLRAVLNETLFYDPETSVASMCSNPENKYNMILNIFLEGIKSK